MAAPASEKVKKQRGKAVRAAMPTLPVPSEQFPKAASEGQSPAGMVQLQTLLNQTATMLEQVSQMLRTCAALASEIGQ